MRCAKVEPHEEHWHTIIANGVTIAGGMCAGEGRGGHGEEAKSDVMKQREETGVLYQGRRWDAPMADDAQAADLTGRHCNWCGQPITADDDAMMLGGAGHTECILRSVMGDVPHLEEKCICYGGHEVDVEGTYREQSQRAVDWLITHRLGGWRE